MRDGLVDQRDKFYKRVASANVTSYKVIDRGQLVVGFPIDEGVLDFQRQYDQAIVSPAYRVWDMRDDLQCDQSFLRRYLRSHVAIAYYKLKLQGSTARRRSLRNEAFLELDVPLPPLPEQRRIAAILDQADAIRAKRRRMLEHLDSLTQSIFHEMFGEDISTTDTVQFRDVAVLSSGRNLVADDEKSEAPYRVLKISSVTSGEFKPQESKPLPFEYVPPQSHIVENNDLLMSRANTTDLVGAVALAKHDRKDLSLPDKIWKFDWRISGSEPVFYKSLFAHPAIRRRISGLSSGSSGSMKNIPKEKLYGMSLPLIPPERQREFVSRTTRIASSRDGVARALTADDELFASLQYRAFRGEL